MALHSIPRQHRHLETEFVGHEVGIYGPPGIAGETGIEGNVGIRSCGIAGPYRIVNLHIDTCLVAFTKIEDFLDSVTSCHFGSTNGRVL